MSPTHRWLVSIAAKRFELPPLYRYQRHRERQEAEHRAWEEREKERAAKLARGEKAGPPERDPTAVYDVGVLDLIRVLAFTVLIVLLAGKFFTGDFLWEYRTRWTNLKRVWPVEFFFSRISLPLTLITSF